jgi:hypothetical protein
VHRDVKAGEHFRHGAQQLIALRAPLRVITALSCSTDTKPILVRTPIDENNHTVTHHLEGALADAGCGQKSHAPIPSIARKTDYCRADELAERETDQDTHLGAGTLIYRCHV